MTEADERRRRRQIYDVIKLKATVRDLAAKQRADRQRLGELGRMEKEQAHTVWLRRLDAGDSLLRALDLARRQWMADADWQRVITEMRARPFPAYWTAAWALRDPLLPPPAPTENPALEEWARWVPSVLQGRIAMRTGRLYALQLALAWINCRPAPYLARGVAVTAWVDTLAALRRVQRDPAREAPPPIEWFREVLSRSPTSTTATTFG